MKHGIVGNGPAGVVAAETLRNVDLSATIALIRDEPEPRYSRRDVPCLIIGDIDDAGTHPPTIAATTHAFESICAVIGSNGSTPAPRASG
jgi:hypothetical protein